MKTAIITGASSGIGLETAKLFIKNGWNVINISNSETTELEKTYPCDISNKEALHKVFEEIKKEYNKIDLLFNCAGYGISGAMELIPAKDAEHIYEVNLFGTLNCIRETLPLMKAGAKIINVGSAMALFPVPFRGLYASSKAAVNTLSYSLRMECAPCGIDVTTICPGDVKTNFTKNRIKHYETNERYGDRIQKATQHVDGREGKRMPASKVANTVYKLSKKKKMKPMVIVGGKYKLLYFAMRFLPLNWLLLATNKLLGGNKKHE